ncbi:MAG: tRNA pseudouridine(38-40) synthase TruA [Chthoniobacterales bacterium]
MSRRLQLVVAYDGRPFAGWQSQANGNTVQDYLEKSFARVAGTRLRVHGAGRTDAGVHALAQCAHVDVPDKKLSCEVWTSALNSYLPATIRVLRCREVSGDFHARFSAKGKIYRYRIWNDRILPPLEDGRAWHVPTELDVSLIREAARAFVGRHNFAAFAANRGKPVADTVRTIKKAIVRQSGRCITLEFSGDGFLYKMVRLMVGALVQIGSGKLAAGVIEERLCDPKKRTPMTKLVAPAEGLFLVRVRY